VATRSLPLRLLAANVLVSLTLIVASAGAAFYLRHVHVGVSRVLTENVESTIAAKDLEKTITEMLQLLRGRSAATAADVDAEIDRHLAQARTELERAAELANLDEESHLVATIRAGLAGFTDIWAKRSAPPEEAIKSLEQRVRPACRKLLDYNAAQVDASDRENRRIVALLTWGLVVVGIVAPLSGLLLGYGMARRIYHSIYHLSVRIRDATGRLNGETNPVTLVQRGDAVLSPQIDGIVHEVERVVERLQQREREVLRAEQLAAVGQVAAGVAHELRNPLTSVKMLVQTGLEGPRPAGLPPEDLSIIEHEVRRMEACIQTFLDFARPPSAERRRTDLVVVVRRALALVEGRARRQHVTWSTDLPHGPVELLIDGEQIHQVLVNLLLNALDAMPHGGTIHVQVRGPTADSPQVAISVRDSGPGIASAIRPRLFEPFVSNKETGLGLGLSLSRRLVEAHGGTIHGDNPPQGGAAFTFTLPL
jgi:signal transduction histidine kinase